MTEHALITWLSCTDDMTAHALTQSCLNELNFTGGFPKVQPPVIEEDIEVNLEKVSLRQFCSRPQDCMSILEIGTWEVAQE